MVRPINQFVLIRPLEEENVTKSGIITAPKPKEGQRATVLAVSPEIPHSEVSEGDVVLFQKYGPDSLKVGEEDAVFIEYDDIYGIITNE